MSFGEVFADAWQGAKDTARKSATAIASGAKKVGSATKWAGGQVVDGAKWAGGKVVDGAQWTGEKIVDGAQWTGEKIVDGAQWTGEKIVDGAQWAGEKIVDGAQWAKDRAVDLGNWAVDTAVSAANMVVNALGIAMEVARNLAGIVSVASQYLQGMIGLPISQCISDWLRNTFGETIEPEEAAEAAPYADLAAAVYGDEVPEGWTKISPDDPRFAGIPFEDENGFQAAIYETGDGKAVLAFAGTQDGTDWKTNFQQGIGKVPGQYEMAKQLAQRSKFVYGDDLTITGHSLGGGLATFAGLNTGTPTYAFNAAGLAQGARDAIGSEKLADNTPLINNYNVIGEALSDGDFAGNSSTFGIDARQVGDIHWIPATEGNDPVQRHFMETVISGLGAAASP